MQVTWPYPQVVAHRGGGVLAPENTLIGLRCAQQHGFRGVEFDVMLTADDIPVLMHDPFFGRTVRGTGEVAATPFAQLLRMDAGAWFDAAFAGEPVPSLAQAIGFCQAHGIWMNIEIKPSPGREDITGDVVARAVRAAIALPQASSAPGPLLSSFSEVALLAARAAAPEVPRGLLIDQPAPDWPQRLQAVAAVALHLNHQHASAALVRDAHARGVGVFCYTVNSRERAEVLLGWGVDGFCTDRLDLFRPR